MDKETREAMKRARDALFALSGPRRTIKEMENYPCHSGINTPERCGRCSRDIAAWDSIDEINRILNTEGVKK